jgi:hypothetical protein
LASALFELRWVPGQVDVDLGAEALMVKALTRCIGCTHQPNIALLDGRLDLLPRGRDPAEIPIFAMMTTLKLRPSWPTIAAISTRKARCR